MSGSNHLQEQLIPYLRRADSLIVSRFRDARSHAALGLIAFASQRLSDLSLSLVGPAGSGIIGDARAAFFRAAHAGPFDPDLHDPDRRFPTAEGIAAARTAPVGGIDADKELALKLEAARMGLVTAAAVGGEDGWATRQSAIDTWHEQHATAIRSWARRTLSDSQMAIFHAVVFLRAKPEHRE